MRELLRRVAGAATHVPAGSGPELWNELVEFGALGVGPGADELGAVEVALVARALGERLAAVPLVGTAAVRYVAGADPGRRPSAPSLSRRARPPVRARVAGHDPAGRPCLRREVRRSVRRGRGRAGRLRVGRRRLGARGRGPGTAGVTITRCSILDETLDAADVHLDGVAAVPLGLGRAGRSCPAVAAVAAVLASAEAVGAAARPASSSRATTPRPARQFGKTISFQAVRHLLADMVVKVESSWSSVPTRRLARRRRAGRSQDASVAKAWASRATLDVAHGALQVFGGIAFTAEHPAHRFLRRIASLGAQYGPRPTTRAVSARSRTRAGGSHVSDATFLQVSRDPRHDAARGAADAGS